MEQAYVYLLANRRHGTLYAGVTSDLVRRVHQHRTSVTAGFSARYRTTQLVWFETTPSILAAIAREKQLKNWKRAWKVALIEAANPTWRDLYPRLLG
ncbi:MULTISPECIES: GIY-YIG nuclease family protein [Ramlibacter]|uniref:GIY-YIG nuclease family protein n=1 Tax=Ramlibacter pinisoli TaxID=2682844 RepID=A0A6N8IM47_9BURK|nr:GIY-YIG nuclease family protein [Ramlibacter sp. CGMCC 1.13660]MVQ27897.1 GIY-YIG nuclease family protein [Ramlibacter pinisoli]